MVSPFLTASLIGATKDAHDKKMDIYEKAMDKIIDNGQKNIDDLLEKINDNDISSEEKIVRMQEAGRISENIKE